MFINLDLDIAPGERVAVTGKLIQLARGGFAAKNARFREPIQLP